jgi:hypothetical protein
MATQASRNEAALKAQRNMREYVTLGSRKLIAQWLRKEATCLHVDLRDREAARILRQLADVLMEQPPPSTSSNASASTAT